MVKPCKHDGCKRDRGIVDGYCRVHLSHADKPTLSPSKSDIVKNDKLQKKLDAMELRILHLEKENIELTNMVGELNDSIDVLTSENDYLKVENGDLKTQINKNFLANDGLNQYGRKESIRLHNIPESTSRGDDNKTAITAIKDTAKTLGIEVLDEDIQRCHRVGKFKKGKARQIICRFRWFKKRMDFIRNKKKLKTNTDRMSLQERKAAFKKAPFITEDLSPYRGKVFRFVRSYNEKYKTFEIVTTFNGLISCKKRRDDDNWLNISSSQNIEINSINYDEYKDEYEKKFREKIDELLF